MKLLGKGAASSRAAVARLRIGASALEDKRVAVFHSKTTGCLQTAHPGGLSRTCFCFVIGAAESRALSKP
jgi:hypothetical protein